MSIPEPRHCAECGYLFVATKHNQKYCGDECRDIVIKARERARNRRKSAYYVPPIPWRTQERGKRVDQRTDCRNYSVCLSTAAKALAASVPCAHCTNYVAEDIRAHGPIGSLGSPAVGIDGVGEGNRRRRRRGGMR